MVFLLHWAQDATFKFNWEAAVLDVWPPYICDGNAIAEKTAMETEQLMLLWDKPDQRYESATGIYYVTESIMFCKIVTIDNITNSNILK